MSMGLSLLFRGQRTAGLTSLALTLLLSAVTTAQTTRTWDGGGLDNNWTTAANWTGDTVPSTFDTTVFDATSAKNAFVNTNVTVAAFTMSAGYAGTVSPTGGLIISEGDVLLEGGTLSSNVIVLSPTALVTVNGATITNASIISNTGSGGPFNFVSGNLTGGGISWGGRIEQTGGTMSNFSLTPWGDAIFSGGTATPTSFMAQSSADQIIDFGSNTVTFSTVDSEHKGGGSVEFRTGFNFTGGMNLGQTTRFAAGITVTGSASATVTVNNNATLILEDGVTLDLRNAADYRNSGGTVTQNGTAKILWNAVNLGHVDANGAGVTEVELGRLFYASVSDRDERTLQGLSSTTTVTVESLTTGDAETLSLAEVGFSIFRNAVGLLTGSGPANPQDGILQAQIGESVRITYTDPQDPIDTLSVTQTVVDNVEQEITVTAGPLVFADQGVGAGASVAQTITITNDGTDDLNFMGLQVELTGTNAADFAIASDSGESILAPSASRTVNIAFDPAADGAKTAAVTITSNDQDEGTVNVSLSGTGVDDVGPTADTITPSTTGPTNASTIDFTVTFSETTVNFDAAADVTIAHAGTTNAGVTITGGPITYTVSVTGITGTGNLTLAVNATSDVQDSAGNALSASVTSDTVSVDTIAPTVTVDPLTTSDTTPPLSGTVNDPAASISVTVDGQTNPATNNGATWTLADGTLTALAPGTYGVLVTATDALGNVGFDSTTSELTLASTNPGNGGTVTNNRPPEDFFPGERLVLTGPDGGFNYQWKKDGIPMVEDAPRITGTQTQILVIDPIRPTDQGSYTVAYDDGLAKKIVETEPFLLIVNPPMPAAGLWALGALALALLAAGLVIVKRSGHSSHAKS